MTPERWRYTSEYIRTLFGKSDAHLLALVQLGESAGIPRIAVTAEVGRLLKMLTSMTRGQLALELGTLVGYSATWIARGLRQSGRLITVEADRFRADMARAHLDRSEVGSRVEVRVGGALDVLPELIHELGEGSVDLVFFDANKAEYPAYWSYVRPLIAPGGILVADNVLGSSQWWIDDEGHPDREGADALNRLLASDEAFEAVAMPLREGLLVARRHD